MTVEQELKGTKCKYCDLMIDICDACGSEIIKGLDNFEHYHDECIIKRVRDQVIKEVIEYLRQRKRNAKNLYKMDNVMVSPKIALSIVTKLINDCEKKFLVEKEVKKHD